MGAHSVALVVVLAGVAWALTRVLTPTLPPVWGGYVDSDFKQVGTIFKKAIEDGVLKGGSVAAYYKGKPVVDLWGGYADDEAGRPWRADTVSLFYSVTKMVGAFVIGQMVDKGLLDYKKPVAYYWPEFGQHGKDKVTVEMLLSHQAGLAILEPPVHVMDIRDKPKEMVKLFASQKPQYEPGSMFGYHSVSIAMYVDSLVRIVDPKHRNMSQIFYEDIAKPFDIDYHIGLPKQLNYRAARIYPMSIPQMLWKSLLTGNTQLLYMMYLSMPWTGSTWFRARQSLKNLKNGYSVNDPELASIGLSSYNGWGTARALAQLTSILANGGTHKGKQLLSADVIKKLGSQLVDGIDQTLEIPSKLGPGPFLRENPKGEVIFGHPGFGGQVAFVDPHTGLGFAFCMNHHSDYHNWNDPVMIELQNTIYKIIENKNS